jgi:hypothetical protein
MLRYRTRVCRPAPEKSKSAFGHSPRHRRAEESKSISAPGEGVCDSRDNVADGAYRGRDAKGRREPICRIRLGLRCHTAQGPGRTVNDEAGRERVVPGALPDVRTF